jgi:hypothetical protein
MFAKKIKQLQALATSEKFKLRMYRWGKVPVKKTAIVMQRFADIHPRKMRLYFVASL